MAYFRRWPPPPCWLPYLVEAVWGVDRSDEAAVDPYFERTAGLGFGGKAEYERDVEDPKWLDR